MAQNTVDDASSKKIIRIIRKWETPNSTVSTLQFGDYTGYTLEPPGQETYEADHNKRIPVDNYHLKWHDSTKMPKYSPLLLLYNEKLSEERAILIHTGNAPKDTTGDLLVGATYNREENPDWIGESVKKFLELKAYLPEPYGDLSDYIVSIESQLTPP